MKDCKLQPEIFREINNIWGPLEIDLFASRTTKQPPEILQLEAELSSRGNRCFQAPLETTSLRQPTLGNNPNDTLRSQNTKSNGGVSCPSLEISGLVPSNAEPTVSPPMSDTSTRNNSSTDPPISASIQKIGRLTGHMALIRRSCQEGELSEEATSLLMASWRSKSQTFYNLLFHHWECRCHSRGRDPICGPVGDIANFFAELLKEGYSYNSLNAYRSAISSVHVRSTHWATPHHFQSPQGSIQHLFPKTSLPIYLESSTGSSMARLTEKY